MFSWLKKHFIAHKGNDHRPHLLRKDMARSLVILVLLFEATVIVSSVVAFSSQAFLAAVFPAVLGDLTNIEREKNNLSDLATNPMLDQAANLKAHDMAAKGYFAHTSPEGKTPWYWLDQVGYDFDYAGENLAINFKDSEDVTRAWMNSPDHRANIEKTAYTEMGTGIATGMYKGAETIFVAQVYARPAKAIAAAAPEIRTETSVAQTTTVTDQASVLAAEASPAVSTAPQNSPNFLDRLRASPHNSMNVILSVLAAVVGLALVLKLVIHMRADHIDLVTNGLCVIAVIGAVYVANIFIFQNKANIAPAASFEAFSSVVK